MYLAVGDESGNHSNQRHPFLAVAGYLAETYTWRAFSKHWTKRLAEFGLESFHMQEFFSRTTRPYKDWSDQICEDRILQLIEIINTYNLRGFAVQVSRDDYDQFLSARVKKRFTHDPYVLVFDTVISEILLIMHSFPIEEQVTMYFHNSSLEKKAREVHGRRQQRDPYGHRLADNLQFVSDDFVPIQAADILAYLARNYLRGTVGGSLAITNRIEKYVRLLVTRTPTCWRHITADDLRRTDTYLAPWSGRKPNQNRKERG